MEENLLEFIIMPSKEELRKHDVIDEIGKIPTLNIPTVMFLAKNNDYLVNGAVINYNNEIVMAKSFYVLAQKYKEMYEKESIEAYEFWSRKYIEQTIKELFCIYDKSIHILNFLYQINEKTGLGYNANVAKKLKNKNEEFYEKCDNIYRKISKYNDLRDDITHNSSSMFVRIVPAFDTNKIKTGWKIENSLTIENGLESIENIASILKENNEIITEKLKDFYQNKESKEYKKKIGDDKSVIENIKKKIK